MSVTDTPEQWQNRQQIGSWYDQHNSWLNTWLRSKLGCHSRAADLAHDTFLKLLSKDTLPVIEEPRAYLTTVAQRVLSNHWRRERIEQAYLEVLATMPDVHAPSAEEKYLLMETLMQIDQALEGLPVVVKQAFFYAQLEGMKYAEIALRLNISVSTVKRYLIKAGSRCYFALDTQ